MRPIFKAILIVLLFIVPAAVVNASNASTKVESVSVVPVKFSQQIVTGTSPEWQRLAPAYAAQSPLPVRGQAMYYNPGVMQKVIAYRQRLHQIDECADCIGHVALLRSGDINRRIWLQISEDTVEGPFLVTDVAARHDIPRLLRIGWGIDVDWETAQRWNMRMPLVTILDAPPAGMIINSTAHWKAALQSTARQFNEVAAWREVAPSVPQYEPVTVHDPMIEVRTVEKSVQPNTAPPIDLKGTLVNNIFFKQGPMEIRMERQN